MSANSQYCSLTISFSPFDRVCLSNKNVPLTYWSLVTSKLLDSRLCLGYSPLDVSFGLLKCLLEYVVRVHGRLILNVFGLLSSSRYDTEISLNEQGQPRRMSISIAPKQRERLCHSPQIHSLPPDFSLLFVAKFAHLHPSSRRSFVSVDIVSLILKHSRSLSLSPLLSAFSSDRFISKFPVLLLDYRRWFFFFCPRRFPTRSSADHYPYVTNSKPLVYRVVRSI